MCLPSNVFLGAVKSSSQGKKNLDKNRNMVVIRMAKRNVVLVSATADITCGHWNKKK